MTPDEQAALEIAAYAILLFGLLLGFAVYDMARVCGIAAGEPVEPMTREQKLDRARRIFQAGHPAEDK